MWIEFAGGVGAGKSSLASALRQRLDRAGVSTFSPQEAFQRYTAQAFPLGFQSPELREDRTIHFTRWALLHAMLAVGQARFSMKHPGLIQQVIASADARRSLPRWHQKIILALFFRVAGWYEYLSPRPVPGEVVVVEEGLVHRAVNLFAWEPGMLDQQQIRRYLERLPPVPLTVVVRAPVDVCLDRTSRRGLPIRLQGKSPFEIRRFIEHSDAIAAQMGPVLQARRQPIIEITNIGMLDQSIAELMDQVMANYPAISPFLHDLRTESRTKDRSV